ncbi:MAG: ATP-dependent DNA ligase [Actinomycetes bacterium]
MDLPVQPPVSPMLAKAVDSVPPQDAVPGGLVYEPKWDGFRCIAFRDGDEVELGSRGEKMLTRYFPDLVEQLRDNLPQRCVVDGEIVVRIGEPGAERLDWDTLAQRIHPAESRVRKLAAETPASFVAFDLLAVGDDSLMSTPFSERRTRLEEGLRDVKAPVHLTRTTDDPDEATSWFSEFEGAGLDGVVAKPLRAQYQEGKRVMLKVKYSRTADVAVVGYRVHKSGEGVGSLLLGLYTDSGDLAQVGGASAFSTKRRLELVDELEPYVMRDDAGQVVRGAGEPNRFQARQDHSFIRLRPELVAEVKFDQMENHRFRHAVQFLRWRPDREARSCGYEQIDRPVAYDLDAVLTGGR